MKTTSYICDCCKKSVSQGDLVSLNVSCSGLYFSNNSYRPTTNTGIDICKSCLSSRGFIIEKPDSDQFEQINKQNERTLEERFIDILEDLGVAFVE